MTCTFKNDDELDNNVTTETFLNKSILDERLSRFNEMKAPSEKNRVHSNVKLFCSNTYRTKKLLQLSDECRDFTDHLFALMIQENISLHFNIYLIDGSSFDSYSRGSIDTENESWFCWVYKMKRLQQKNLIKYAKDF